MTLFSGLLHLFCVRFQEDWGQTFAHSERWKLVWWHHDGNDDLNNDDDDDDDDDGWGLQLCGISWVCGGSPRRSCARGGNLLNVMMNLMIFLMRIIMIMIILMINMIIMMRRGWLYHGGAGNCNLSNIMMSMAASMMIGSTLIVRTISYSRRQWGPGCPLSPHRWWYFP